MSSNSSKRLLFVREDGIFMIYIVDKGSEPEDHSRAEMERTEAGWARENGRQPASICNRAPRPTPGRFLPGLAVKTVRSGPWNAKARHTKGKVAKGSSVTGRSAPMADLPKEEVRKGATGGCWNVAGRRPTGWCPFTIRLKDRRGERFWVAVHRVEAGSGG
jgi:hypothetical protein